MTVTTESWKRFCHHFYGAGKTEKVGTGVMQCLLTDPHPFPPHIDRVSDNTPLYGRRWNAWQRCHTIGSCCNTSHCSFVGFISYYTLPASRILSDVDDPDLTTSPERMDGESDKRHFNLDQSAGSG